MITTLITGASRGLGKTIANNLVSNSHKIINLSLNNINPNCENYKCDISNINETYDIVNEILKTHKIDNLIFNKSEMIVSPKENSTKILLKVISYNRIFDD